MSCGNCQLHLFDDKMIIPSLLRAVADTEADEKGRYFSAPDIDLDKYDHIVVCVSGKDATASLLHLLDMGVDKSKIELWHHLVDGNEGSTLVDWAFMDDYWKKFAAALDLPIYFSWLEGGFESEMLKQNAYSKPHKVETPEGLITLPRDETRAQIATRRKFPQVSPSLQSRWCSSSLKIDVGRRAINNQPRFDNKNVLFITGERREESSNRAKYFQLEPHACDRRNGRRGRLVDAWRPVLHWSESQVWSIQEKHRVAPQVPYRLGWGRSSCQTCIYNSGSIWATINEHWPERVQKIAWYEREFGTTISRKKIDVLEQAASASPMEIDDLAALRQASQKEYTLPIFVPEGQEWVLPKGAFAKESCGVAS
ncbi:MAG: phosphoadenosine phosphosulfate reductase family protein [Halothiobacillus sp.]|nr:phosphoadenosine phosphosulfate reductase family protein [Halothiobacillus sp.]